jgi:hypothetical protein
LRSKNDTVERESEEGWRERIVGKKGKREDMHA